ncbi:MAG: hypothetical protein HY901_11475 [Deltaproteobacteria bacterium]|nr:hypothetical protein [Deltaproteobacteria bacterium]
MKRATLPILLLLLGILAAGSTPDAGPTLQEPTDRELFEYATRIAEAHRRADAKSVSEPGVAAQELGELLEWPWPSSADAYALRADLHARRAQLLLAAGRWEDAELAVGAGIAESEQQNISSSALTAQLWLRFGEVKEARGDDLGAVQAYQAAIRTAKDVLIQRREGRKGP